MAVGTALWPDAWLVAGCCAQVAFECGVAPSRWLTCASAQYAAGAARQLLLKLSWSDWHTGADAACYVAWDGSVTPNAEEALQVVVCVARADLLADTLAPSVVSPLGHGLRAH